MRDTEGVVTDSVDEPGQGDLPPQKDAGNG